MSSTEPVRRFSGMTTSQTSVPTTAGGKKVFAKEVGGDSQNPADAAPTGYFRAIKNLDSANPIFLGPDNTVSSATGWQVDPGETFTFSGAGGIYMGDVYAIATGGAVNVCMMQY